MVYKVIPAPTVVNIKVGHYEQACDLYADAINAEAANGWKFVALESITTKEKVGCIKKEAVFTNIYMLIFCKEQ